MAQIKDIKLGTKYVDRKTLNKEVKRIGEVIEVNEKTKTVTLQFEDGKTRPFVVTTLSKSFAKLDAVAEEKEPAVTVGDTPLEDVAGDGTPLAEVGKEIAEQAKQKAEEHKKLNESAKKTSEIINKAEAKEEAEKKPKKEKKPSKPKKEDKQVIDTAIKALDEAKAEHKESWQNKGTAMYIGKIRVFECWKRMERMRINYNPELTSIDAKLCVSLEEGYRTGSHLSATCYVQADKVADAVKELVKNINKKAVDDQTAKKAEKKPKKKVEKAEPTTAKKDDNPAKDSSK